MTEPLLKGAIDMHVHVAPDVMPRRSDFLDIAKEALDAGMKGLVFKDSNALTTDRAYAVNKLFPGFQAFGALVLNMSVGGLNPHAVRAAIALGTKVIWMPSLNTAHSIEVLDKLKWKFLNRARLPIEKGLTILDKKDELIPEVIEILNIAAKADVVLATGHLSPRESLILIEEARKLGIEKILVTHASSESINASIDEQKEMVRRGAYVEHSFASCMPAFDRLDPELISQSIRAVKAEHCVMSTDFGQTFNPSPIEGLTMFIRHMQKLGITDEEIRFMVSTVPAKLLGISE